MHDPTHAERQRRYRQRITGQAPAVPVCGCGKQANRPQYGGLCSRCWRKTSAGREWQRLRIAAYRAKKKAP